MEGSSNNKEVILTVSQFIFIIFGCIVGVGLLSLPNGSVEVAHQDGWISTLIGGIYPLYVVLIARYISKKFPDDTILTLSKRYFGKFIGSILNLIFATYFIFFATMISSYYSNLMRSYSIGFLSSFKVIAILFILIIYVSSRDLKVLGVLSEICFSLTAILILSPIAALKFPNMTNIHPVFGSGFSSIAKGSMKSAFAYSGAEIILLIYPFLKKKEKMLISSLISVAFVVVMYVWCVFVTTYYLGPDIVEKSHWSFLLVTGSVTISVINNFRYVFMFLWSLIAFKSISINSYASIYILKDITPKIKMKQLCFFMYPLFVFITLKYGNEISRVPISENITKYYVLFNLSYMTVIAILVLLKRGANA